MIKPKTYSVNEIYNSTYLSFEASFYTNKDTQFIMSELQNISNKNIQITNDKNIEPSYSSIILLKEYEGKKPLYKLKSTFYKYDIFSNILQPICKWISEQSKTDYSNKLKIGLSYNNNVLESLYSINNMNTRKLVLRINENFINSKFPQFKNSAFAMSVKKLIPMGNYINSSNILINLNNGFNVLIGENYGIDFSEYIHGILYYNYIGGKDYASDFNKIKEVLEYLIIDTFNCINEDGYNADEIKTLDLITYNYKKYIELYYNPDKFIKEFKDLKIAVDLNTNIEYIRSYWPVIRGNLFQLINECGVTSGIYNYNSEEAMHELKNCKLIDCNLSRYHLVNVEGNGVFENCDMIGCTLEKSNINKCNLYFNNTIKESYLNCTVVESQSLLEKCFVLNNEETLNCKLKESVVIFGIIGSKANIDENTVVVENPRIGLLDNKSMPAMAHGVEITKPKDYKWFKELDKQINPKKIRYN